MRCRIDVNKLRDGTAVRDRAILDLLQLRSLRLAPGSVSVAQLRLLWNVSQSQVSRRMTAMHQLGVYVIKAGWGRYKIFPGHDLRAARWEAQRQQFRRIFGG